MFKHEVVVTCKIPVSLCTDIIGRVVSWFERGSGVWIVVVEDSVAGVVALTGDLSFNLLSTL
jgi:hypothetical protein